MLQETFPQVSSKTLGWGRGVEVLEEGEREKLSSRHLIQRGSKEEEDRQLASGFLCRSECGTALSLRWIRGGQKVPNNACMQLHAADLGG